MNFTIRQANEQDIDFIAWVILTASRSGKKRGFWDMLLEQDDIQILEFLKKFSKVQLPCLCHYQVFRILEVNKIPAAGMSCFFPEDVPGENFRSKLRSFLQEEGWSENKIKEGWQRLSSHFSCFPGFPPENWIIEWVACGEEYRRQGLISALLKDCLALGAKRGAQQYQVVVANNNIAAELSYTKAGFSYADEKTSLEFEKDFGYPGIKRLVIKKGNSLV